jgi:hypothetical protein
MHGVCLTRASSLSVRSFTCARASAADRLSSISLSPKGFLQGMSKKPRRFTFEAVEAIWRDNLWQETSLNHIQRRDMPAS